MSNFTPAEMAILRRSAAKWKGSALPKSIGARLRLAMARFQVLRNRKGAVAGFGREGFVLTPTGWGLYTWNEERMRQAHINESISQEL
jgi:hypothetical protein